MIVRTLGSSISNTECVIEIAEMSIDDEKAERMRMRRFLERRIFRRRGIGANTRSVSAKMSAARVI